MLWTVAIALAGLKTMPVIGMEGWVPVQPVPAGQVEGQVTCVEWPGSGLPRSSCRARPFSYRIQA